MHTEKERYLDRHIEGWMVRWTHILVDKDTSIDKHIDSAQI